MLKNFLFLRILALAATLLMSQMSGAQSSKAAIYAGPQAGWLVISSHSYRQDAVNMARKHARNFPSVVVFSATNGYFAVSVGWVSNQVGKATSQHFISIGYIPADSYISKGARWVDPVWTANNSHLSDRRTFLSVSRLSIPGGTANPPLQPVPTPPPIEVTDISPTPAQVGGLKRSGDGYLSLRRGPGTSYSEIVRMRSQTRLTITGKSNSWYRVKLDDGATAGATGFAHSDYVKIVDIPIVGPETNTVNDVPVVGPEPADDVDSRLTEDVELKIDVISQDQKRVALVLGNSDYQHTAVLANPKNDADSIGSTLEKLGFTVVKGLDLTKAGMELAIREFVRELPGTDVALFFYAGHAMQVGGANYLIPVDAALEDATAIDFETINFNVIINFMSERDRTSIALLDACRNNPLARNFTRSLGKTRSAFVGRGLAAPTSGDGQLLIGFATAPGEVALDGEGKNSPFTSALLDHIETPGLEIELMLKRVKSDVFDETDGSQSPWNNSALRKEFYFVK